MPSRTPAATTRKKKTTPARRNGASRKKGKKPVRRHMPVWVRNLYAALLVALFTVGFYYFVIRPYAYRWQECAGRKAYGICVPCCYDVHGIDISHHQGLIDWDALVRDHVADYPIQFVFMKATEGGDHSDDAFVRNFEEAGRRGIIRGAYHFFSPRTDPAKQADFFIRTVKLTKGDLPPVLDIEVSGKKSPAELQKSVRIWLDKVEGHYGVKPILYTSYKFKNKYLSHPDLDRYPYWIAHYYVDSVKYTGQWHFWQHSDIGTVPGIKEDVDLNVFNGTFEQLQELMIH